MKKWLGLFGLAALVAVVVFVNLNANAKRPEGSASIGQAAPDFSLTDAEGKTHKLSDYKGSFVVLEWVNHGCPYVKKHYDTGNMQKIQDTATGKNVVWLSVCSSAPGKQGFMSPQEWKASNQEKKVNATAVLLDPTGDTGRLYGAKTTPHMFVINDQGVLIYKGAIDDKPTTDKSDVEGANNYVLAALDQSMGGQAVSTPQTEAYGCSVKY